jgi:hypothetical protein
MKTELIAIYCICDDYIKQRGIISWPNEKMNPAEVITTLIASTMFFGGNLEQTRIFLLEEGYIPKMLCKGQLNFRIHRLDDTLWEGLLTFLQKYLSQYELEEGLLIDSFPIAICKNVRAYRCKVVHEKQYFGFNACKKEYFYGIKVSVLSSLSGFPLHVALVPGSMHDLKALRKKQAHMIPANSVVYGDAAYLCASFEQSMKRKKVRIVAARRSNSKCLLNLTDYFGLRGYRKSIETAFSGITRLMPRSIHAVTLRGFCRKVMGFILAFAFSRLCFS